MFQKVAYLLYCCILCYGGFGYAQDGTDFKIQNSRIDQLYLQNDTTALATIFEQNRSISPNELSPAEYAEYLNFRFKKTRFLSVYSKITADSAISLYNSIHEDAMSQNEYEISALVLGKIATTYRSKRELARAFEYNQKEIEAAKKSTNTMRVGSALITELDIAYNSLPWPIQKEDLTELVAKSAYVITYSEENNLPYILAFGKLYLSKFYIKQESFEQARTVLESISDDSPLSVAFSKYEHLCEIAKQTGELKTYRLYTLAFKKLAYQTKRPFVSLNAHNYLLDYSIRIQNRDSSTYYAQLLEQNLSEVDTTKYLDFLDVTYETLARHFSGIDLAKELQYTSYSAKVNKMMSERQRVAFSSIMRYKSELANLEQQNTDLEDSKAFIKNNLWLLIGLSAVLLIVLFFLFKKFRQTRSEVTSVKEEKDQLVETVTKKSIELHNKQRVFLDELLYLKADRNYVEFYTESKRYIDRNILSSLLTELPPNFLQVHRSYVVNKNFITSVVGNHINLSSGVEIPFSRTFKNRLGNKL